MHPKQFALVMGIILLAMGALAFIPNLMSVPVEGLPSLRLESGYGLFLNFLPMNIVSKLLLVAFGVAGIAAYSNKFRSLPASINWSRALFAVMGTLSLLGMIDATSTLFGFAPLYGNYIWVHGLASLFGAYFGYGLSSVAKAQMENGPVMRDAGISTRSPTQQL